MELETRLLRYFLAVAEELNFSRAASKLYIAQPSLSAQIRHLEAQLGVPLLRRSTHAVSLTEAGQALFAQGPAALAAMDLAWQAARQAGRGEVGTLRLAYSLSAGHDTAPGLVDSLHQAYPGIVLTTEVLPTPKVLLAVRDGRADVGIARAPAPMEGVELQPLRHDSEGILVSADHPLAREQTVELTAVARYPVVVHPRSSNPSHYDFIVDIFASRMLQPSFIERDITFDLNQRFIAGGEATSLIGHSAAINLPQGFRWVPLANPVTVTVALVSATGEQTAIVQRFQEVALAHATAHGWLDSIPESASVQPT